MEKELRKGKRLVFKKWVELVLVMESIFALVIIGADVYDTKLFILKTIIGLVIILKNHLLLNAFGEKDER